MALYGQASTQFSSLARHKCNDALLFAGCILALLLGFDRLPASQQLAAWCIALGGAAWQAIRVYRQAPPSIESTDEELGSESSLGLQGLLLAAGATPAVSVALVKGIAQDPAGFYAPLLANLPSLAPDPTPSLAQRIYLSSLPWLVIGLASSFIIGHLPAYWGGALALMLMWLAGWGIHRAAKPVLLLTASWLGCFLLARISHII